MLLLVVALTASQCTKDHPVAPSMREPLANLPSDLSAITLHAEGETTAPYTVLEIGGTGTFNGFAIINSRGETIWFYRTTGSPFSFTTRANGNFVFLDSGLGLLEVTPEQKVVHTLAQAQPPGRFMHHDITATSGNTVYFLANDWRTMGDSFINGAAIWEWNPDAGTEQKRWTSFDFFDPVLDRGPRSQNSDWLHENSLSIGALRNIVVSFNFLNQVVSIAPDFQRVEWRLGGIRSTISVADSFSGQHTAQQITPTTVLMFDNGFERTSEPYSRAIEYELRGASAEKAWQWRPTPDNWARVIGSARRLFNGNTLVTFGVPKNLPPGSTGPIEVYEVTASGSVVWHLTLSGSIGYLYRTTPLFMF